MNIGDTLTITIAGKAQTFTVADVAANAKWASVYINADELAGILGAGDGAYNGILSMEKMPDGETIMKSERIEELDRNAVSNNISAVINQSIGGIVGAILIFLALYVNFQDNTRDMLILHMMGYRTKNIRKLLVNVYMPIVWASFLITLAPSILLAKSIQKSLSITPSEKTPSSAPCWVRILPSRIAGLLNTRTKPAFFTMLLTHKNTLKWRTEHGNHWT